MNHLGQSKMKYDKETTDLLVKLYNDGQEPSDIAATIDVPLRSVIAKLSSLGIYRKKQYLNKRGELPVKKEEYIERIAKLLDVNFEILESLEKVNKSVLILLEKALEKTD